MIIIINFELIRSCLFEFFSLLVNIHIKKRKTTNQKKKYLLTRFWIY